MTNAVASLLPQSVLAPFCRRWRITELAVFGSILRADFGPDSDVDVLVTFQADADWSLWDLSRMQDELADMVGRRIDLQTRRAVEASRNRLCRNAILESARTLYAA